jgi:hypothetical protein
MAMIKDLKYILLYYNYYYYYLNYILMLQIFYKYKSSKIEKN